MAKKWTGKLVGLMHDYRITNKMLAAELGVTDRYVSMVLTEAREPEGARERFNEATRHIISKMEAANGKD